MLGLFKNYARFGELLFELESNMCVHVEEKLKKLVK